MIPSKPLAQWCPGDPEQAHAFPSRYYYDAGVFQREVGAIFYPAWHFAGHRSEVSEPGDFIKVDVLDQSVLVVCGEDGVARAFHNVCQHRGTRLVEERRGRIERVIRCPYHAWAYRLDGRLRHAPRSEAVQGFDPGAVSLAPVRIEEVSSFLFVNFDPDATSLREEVGASAALMARHFPDLPDMELVDELDYEVAANWKVIAENAIEGYHFSLSGPVHKDLATLIRFDDYRLTPHDKWWAYMGPTEAGRKQAYGRDIGDAKYQTDWFVNIGFWPHTTLYTFPFTDFVGSFNQFPLGPEKTLLRFAYYRPPRPESEVTKECMRWMSYDLGPEDIELNERQQRGLRSFGYDSGRLFVDSNRGNNSEHLVHHFQSLVAEALSAHQPSLEEVGGG